MSVDKTKKTNLKTSKVSVKKDDTKVVSNKDIEKGKKKDVVKKVVVKRRKVDLKPTKASAVAIASQAAKKQALIEKVSNSELIPGKKDRPSDTKIPLWVWVFFGFSLMLFCISFYQAIIRPQIETSNVMVEGDGIYQVDENVVEGNTQEMVNNDEIVSEEDNSNQVEIEEDQGTIVPKTAKDTIEQFFGRLSDRDFDGVFDLMIPALRNYNDIRTHFTAFRMNPFLDGIVGGRLEPENVRYINSPSYGKDIYNFDLSYVLESNQERYDEIWEFTINTQQENPQISSIRCTSSKCSYHPIFWPENFGLMK